jgi:hypothetical protein
MDAETGQLARPRLPLVVEGGQRLGDHTCPGPGEVPGEDYCGLQYARRGGGLSVTLAPPAHISR